MTTSRVKGIVKEISASSINAYRDLDFVVNDSFLAV